uniref:Uncharacterized protein n=1 Tax=Aegilops tauschii subsp. strangulata TaxID=200361 RepID=A0A453KH15_AEGTS
MQKARGPPNELRLTFHSFPSMVSDFFYILIIMSC